MMNRFIVKFIPVFGAQPEWRSLYARNLEAAKVLAGHLVGRTGRVVEVFAAKDLVDRLSVPPPA